MIDVFREAARYLITSVALITSTGPHGPNVMSAEWTFQVSYRPMRLIVLVNTKDATHENILGRREFGANFLSQDQAALASLAGHYTGRDVSKFSSHIFQTYLAEKIQAPMISGCFLNAECKVSQVLETGDHTMFLGDVVNVQHDSSKSPLLYSQSNYWHRGPLVEKRRLVYLTCTVANGEVRLDGRLHITVNHPQKIELTFSLPNSEPIFQAIVETDERGYFGLVRPHSNKSRGPYLATAKWNDLVGTASTSAE